MFEPSTTHASGNGQAVALSQSNLPTEGPEPIPSMGQRTAAQRPRNLGVLSDLLPGFNLPLGASFDTWRRMRNNPTIAIARAASTAPIRASKVNIGTGDGREDATDEMTQLMRDMLMPQWPGFIRQALFALDYGFKPFEKIYEVRTETGPARIWLRKMKPMRVDNTTVLVDQATGDFAGLRQEQINLAPENSFVYTHDAEDDDCYGRPRHENIRENAWSPWQDVLKRSGQYVTKSAGVIPLVRFSPGTVQDMNGADVDAHEHAQSIVRALGKGQGIIHPIEIQDWAEDLIRNGGGANLDDLLSWQIKFLEVTAGHGSEFIAYLAHFEKLMLRGWLVPERVVTEGQHGTKAEAGVHTDLAMLMAQEVLDDIIRQFNINIIDPIMALNFGPELRGAVVIQATPLGDDTAQFIREMISEILTAPVNSDLLFRFVNFEKMVETAGLPEGEDLVQATAELIKTQQAENDDVDPEDEAQAQKVSAMLSASKAFAAS